MGINAQAMAVLSERDLGQIPVSIGTSLALEGAFGILEEHPNPKPVINQIDVLYVNVRTLVRNLVGSLNPELAHTVFPEDMAAILINEMTVIDQAIRQFTNERARTQFYLCNYRGLSKRFPYAILKAANTERQKFAALREEQTVAELLTLLPNHPHLKMLETDIDLPNDPYRVLMLTSYAVDLLQRYRFSALTLLESHTGATKAQAFWHTKLSNGKELSNIPFDRMTLQFFGDGSNLFTAYPIKYRRVMQSIADKNKWNSLTTKDYIISCVKKAYEPELERLVINLYAKG